MLAVETLLPFLFGGVASCVAETATFPIDTAKTRLQLQGQVVDERYLHRPYKGLLDCWLRVNRVSILYQGLAPALLRQATYGTLKYGLYYSLKSVLFSNKERGKENNNLGNVVCAALAGAVSSFVANPTDVAKVRLQSQLNTTEGVSLHKCFSAIYSEEGLRGLYRGSSATSQRAAIVAAVQLPVYDFTKALLIRHALINDGPINHLTSSFCAGLAACTVSAPIDLVRTRMMDQRVLHHIHPNQVFYTSTWHCALTTVKGEGFAALWRGFVPAFMRMGPWNAIFFIVYERLNTHVQVHRKSNNLTDEHQNS